MMRRKCVDVCTKSYYNGACTISYMEGMWDTMNQSETRRYNRIISQIDEVYHEIAVRQGFSDSAMMILCALSDNEGKCRLADLVKQSGTNKQTINSALRKLEKDEIVYLEPAGGRSKRVCLTEKGYETVENTVNKVLEVEKKIYASWSREEWELYVKLTERYLLQIREEMKEIL